MQTSRSSIRYGRCAFAAFFLVATTFAATARADSFSEPTNHALGFASLQLDAATETISPTRYPSTTGANGAWSTSDASTWTSGFFPGCLWLMYDWTGDPRWKADAEAWLPALESQKNDTSTHDVGFKIFPSFANGYRLTGNDAQRQVALTAAASLATRYSSTVKAIRSWNGPTSSDFRVIIDNMMNLEILFWGAKHGGNTAWYDIAVAHALTTRAQHVRDDGSTYQVVNFNPTTGAVKDKSTHQGYDDESTWSRGQAWAIYGFTMVYRETGDSRFLETARRTADYFIAHLPADAVPYWDFELPSFTGEPRDSSAAATAADGLLELARLEPDAERAQGYLDAAREIVASLASAAYLAEGTSLASVLLHATQNRPSGLYDTGLIYGDYYFIEALLRYQRWFDLAPVAFDTIAETDAGAPVDVELSATDAQECELTFWVIDPPAHGALGAPVLKPCVTGTPNEDTARIVYVPATGYTGADSFSYRATDGTNQSNLAHVSLTIAPAGGPQSTFTAAADSQVKSTSPTTNYGTETTLRVRAPSPEWRTYLRFQVSGVAGSVTQARLRLYVTDASNNTGRVFVTASTWTETGLTWNNAPATSGSALATGAAAPIGAWVEYDVTPAISGNGSFSFALTSASTDSAYFSSREGTHPPELRVTTGTAPPDTTPPKVTSRAPAAGATGVAVASNVTAVFDEPVNGVSATTFTLRQGATTVAATVSYNAGTRTATLDPTATLTAGAVYTAMLTSGITDLAASANALVPVSWSFTTAPAAPSELTFTAAADSQVKSTSPTTNYGTETTLRVRAPSPEWRTYLRFQVSGVAGSVTQARLRLYVTDASNNTGRVFVTASTWTETGLTWNNAPATSGSALATGAAAPIGAWVEYDVTPAISGNGSFSFALTSASTDSAYFSSREGTHPPELRVTTGTAPPDTTPPKVTSRAPAAGATGVAVASNVTAVFDEPVNGVSATTFTLRQGATTVAATVSYNAGTRTATLDPTATLTAGAVYTAMLTSGITDLAASANALVPVSWSFTTAPAAPSELTFTAAADSQVKSTSPTTNYGTETTLRVRAPSPEWRTYLRFQVSGVAGSVTQARLRLYVTDASNNTGRVFVTASTWTETGLTWNNAPATSGSALATGAAAPIGAWVEYDVTPAISGNGSFSFALTSASTDSAYFSSREGTHRPELRVTTTSP